MKDLSMSYGFIYSLQQYVNYIVLQIRMSFRTVHQNRPPEPSLRTVPQNRPSEPPPRAVPQNRPPKPSLRTVP